MMHHTHLVIAFLFSIASIKIFHITNPIFFISIALIAGLFPDIDHPRSKIGRFFKPVSWLFEHRGFLHSILVLPLIALILYYFNYSSFAFPIIVGYLSHLLGDALTKEGIMPLHPISKFRIRGFIRTGGILENILFSFLFFLSAYSLLNL